ncbi:MAG: isocitrate/isopropylmalate dehydrogenase family protein [Coriobacteriia bacterium]|nr:isocitrate/isopropylmalate dehydrogenase family protein [Coriobacteriia bacterium]
MAKHLVTLIPGDGIGPEITRATVSVVEASGVDIEWEVIKAGQSVIEQYNTPLPDYVIDSIKKNKVALKGPLTTPIGTGFRSVNVGLRKALNLYANIRPIKTLPGNGARYEDVDLVVIRENMEDLYAGIEFEKGTAKTRELIETIEKLGEASIKDDAGISIKPISVSGSERIVRFAFEYAQKHKRSKVSAIHKANIMKHTDGLFLEVSRDVAKKYPDIAFDDKIVDATCMSLVLNPHNFDVLVLPNLYGDIVSDLCAGLIGGLGLAPGANIGDEYALFEPVHGTAPSHAGKNEANPSAQILSAVMMLEHLGEFEAAAKIYDALRLVLSKGEQVTYDIKRTLTGSTDGAVSTSDFGQAIIEAMGA